MKLIEYIKQLDNKNYTALGILEELAKCNWEVEIKIGTETINKEPYQKVIYYLEIGMHYEDEGESTYFEPYMFGAGDTIMDAIRYLYKFKENESVELYPYSEEELLELEIQEDNLREYKTGEDIFIENLDNASRFTPYEFTTEHKNTNLITTDYFENNEDKYDYSENFKNLLSEITPNNLTDFNMFNFEIFDIDGECSLITIIKKDKNRHVIYSGTDILGIQSELLYKYINNLIKHKNICSVEVKRIWGEPRLYLKIILSTFTLY